MWWSIKCRLLSSDTTGLTYSWRVCARQWVDCWHACLSVRQCRVLHELVHCSHAQPQRCLPVLVDWRRESTASHGRQSPQHCWVVADVGWLGRRYRRWRHSPVHSVSQPMHQLPVSHAVNLPLPQLCTEYSLMTDAIEESTKLMAPTVWNCCCCCYYCYTRVTATLPGQPG